MVRAMIDGLLAMLEQALLAAGADEQEAAELALCTLATNQIPGGAEPSRPSRAPTWQPSPRPPPASPPHPLP